MLRTAALIALALVFGCAQAPVPAEPDPSEPAPPLASGEYLLELKVGFSNDPSGTKRQVVPAVLTRDGDRIQLTNYDPSLAPMKGSVAGTRFRIDHREAGNRMLFEGTITEPGRVAGTVAGELRGGVLCEGAFTLAEVPSEVSQEVVTWVEVYDVADTDRERFTEQAARMAGVLRGSPACVSHRLLESLTESGKYEFVAISTWKSRSDLWRVLESPTYLEASRGFTFEAESSIYRDRALETPVEARETP